MKLWEQGTGLPLVWKATQTARTCHPFRSRETIHWVALTKTFAQGMIFLRRKGHRPLNGSSIISLETTIAAFPALPLCLCEYPIFFPLFSHWFAPVVAFDVSFFSWPFYDRKTFLWLYMLCVTTLCASSYDKHCQWNESSCWFIVKGI